MPDISMKNMLEAGVHFGHQTHRWNPKMKPFIHGPRNGIYIIDLEKTVKLAQDACVFIRNTVAEGGKVLFVATKKQAKLVAKEAAERASMPFVNERWLGGTLTNFQTIRRGCEKMDELDRWREDGTYAVLPKKEVVLLERKYKKLDASLGGIRALRSLPAALFIIDPEMEKIAVKEANRLGIPVVAIVDTNCNPDLIDYIVPGNDDAIKSVTLFVNLVADACLEGAQLFEQRMRQSAPGHVDKNESTGEGETPKATGPVVERVVRKQLRNIPTEIDYRETPDDDTTTTEEPVEAEAVVEAAAAVEGEAAPEAVVAAPVATAAPKAAKAKAEKADAPAKKKKK